MIPIRRTTLIKTTIRRNFPNLQQGRYKIKTRTRPSVLIVLTEKPNASKDKAAIKSSINRIGFSDEMMSTKLK